MNLKSFFKKVKSKLTVKFFASSLYIFFLPLVSIAFWFVISKYLICNSTLSSFPYVFAALIVLFHSLLGNITSGIYTSIVVTAALIYGFVPYKNSFKFESEKSIIEISLYFLVLLLVAFFTVIVNTYLIKLRSDNRRLLRSEGNLKEVIDNIFSAVLVCTNDKKIEYVNKVVKENFEQNGIRKYKNKSVFDVPLWAYSEKVQAKLNSKIDKTIVSKEMVIYDELIKLKEDKFVFLSLCLSPILNNRGEVVSIAISGNDVTERKRMEQKKDEFISIASHELKTPLTSLNGYVQLLNNRLKMRYEENLNFTKKMDKQIFKLTKLINDLLDISRIQSGKLVLETSMFDMNLLVYESIQEIQPILRGHVINFSKPAEAIFVYADRFRIGQVVTNFLTNAIRYSSEGTEINVTVETENGNCKVSVEDHGAGIPDEKLGQIFLKFFRIEDTEATVSQGLGLGLFISSEIIKKHKGQIGVKSKIAQGSYFYFTLPIVTKNK